MNRVIALTVLALAAAAIPAGAGSTPPASPLPERSSALDPVGASTDYAILDVGAQAPDFAFDSSEHTLRLHDLRSQGHVLLVIAPDDAHLVALERERTRLLASGVVPVAVLDRRAGSCSATARRLGLGFSIIPDPRRVIGAQFNSLDPASRGLAPAWFVLDQSGRVRDLAHASWPDRPWSEVAARALGLPGPDSASPASTSPN